MTVGSQRAAVEPRVRYRVDDLLPGAAEQVRRDRRARDAHEQNVVEAVKLTAGRLGNTPAVARQSYVHPAILEAYLDGAIGSALLEAAEEQTDPPPLADPDEEAEVVRLLRARLRAEGSGRSGRSQRTR